jgi:hypothetical protein
MALAGSGRGGRVPAQKTGDRNSIAMRFRATLLHNASGSKTAVPVNGVTYKTLTPRAGII